MGYSPKSVRDYTEEDWTDPDTPGLPPYPRSKTIAEPSGLQHIRTGLRRPRAETIKPIERSHIATRHRLRTSRGLKTTTTDQPLVDGFEAMQLRDEVDVGLRWLALATIPSGPPRGERTRAVAAAMATLAAGLIKAA